MNKTVRSLKFNEAILEGTDQVLAEDPSVIVMGLGVTDPSGIFGTLSGLHKKYGSKRIIETPTAENGVMGIAIGSSLVGIRPIITHQRVEFSLLAIEQITNQAAKWNYMTDGLKPVPLVIRLIIGRGWGQGPQHSQSLDPWFAHIPGLKVVAPASPRDAKGLMIAAVRDNNPVIMMEHRWLHQTFGPVPEAPFETEIGKARVVREGKDVTIVTYSYMVLEALKTANKLAEANIQAEIIDLQSYRPLDRDTILRSVRKTSRLITLDNGWVDFGIGAEIISTVVSHDLSALKKEPVRLGILDTPIPSTRALANLVYPGPIDIAGAVEKSLDVDLSDLKMTLPAVKDTPDHSFTGPF
jgi:pyruvate/2-oxoglutarate/acetoin dehydrogenase E1 component